jgi:hypothetical protein
VPGYVHDADTQSTHRFLRRPAAQHTLVPSAPSDAGDWFGGQGASIELLRRSWK